MSENDDAAAADDDDADDNDVRNDNVTSLLNSLYNTLSDRCHIRSFISTDVFSQFLSGSVV